MSSNYRNPLAFEAITQATSNAAKAFVDSFYAMLDSDRSSLPSVFRPDQSTFVWDGNSIAMTDLVSFLTQTPLTRHEILSIDAQPVLLQAHDNDATPMLPTPTILITVQGDMKYGTSNFKQGFQHTLILCKASTDPQDRIYFCGTFNVRLHKTPIGLPPPHHQHQNRRGGPRN